MSGAAATELPYGYCPVCRKPFSTAPIHGGGYCKPDDDPPAAPLREINLTAAREIAGELQRGLVTTGNGPKHITTVSKRTATEAWRQAGEIIEALVDRIEASVILPDLAPRLPEMEVDDGFGI